MYIRTVILCIDILKLKTGMLVAMSHNTSSPSKKTQFKSQSKRLMDQVREVLRYHHYAIKEIRALKSPHSLLF